MPRGRAPGKAPVHVAEEWLRLVLDTAHIFTAKRPASGEEVTITIAPSGMGCLLTFQGTPPHDVTDLVRAYQRTPS